jgi:hypothetical protein
MIRTAPGALAAGILTVNSEATWAQAPESSPPPPAPRIPGDVVPRDGWRDRDGRTFRDFRGGGPMGGGGPMAMRGLGQLMEPEFLRRDMPLFVQTLELDKSQTPVLETLLLDYDTAFSAAADLIREKFAAARPQSPELGQQVQQRREVIEQMRAAVQEMRALRDAAAAAEEQTDQDEATDADREKLEAASRARVEELRQRMMALRPPMPQGEELARLRDTMAALAAEWRNTRQQLRGDFVADVHTILTDEQAAQWPDLERLLRREKTLPRSQFSGEGVDLFHVARDMHLNADEHAIVEPILDQYAVTLDSALKARNDRLETLRAETMAAMMQRHVDAASALASEEVALRTAVRDVNERYAELAAQALGDPRGGEFRAQFAQQAFPRIERPTFAQRSFEAALEMDGLTPETTAAIQSLQERYAGTIRAKNAELVAAVRETEPTQITMRVQFWEARMNGQEPSRPDDELRSKFEDRFKFDQDYRTQLEALLTPEQIAQLPPLPEFPAVGEGGPRAPGGRDGGDRTQQRQELMKRFDRNGDGQIDDAELDAIREAAHQRRDLLAP